MTGISILCPVQCLQCRLQQCQTGYLAFCIFQDCVLVQPVLDKFWMTTRREVIGTTGNVVGQMSSIYKENSAQPWTSALQTQNQAYISTPCLICSMGKIEGQDLVQTLTRSLCACAAVKREVAEAT
jgi:hypothetical protein